MSKIGLLYNAAGDVVGRTFVSNDDDLALQEVPEYLTGILEVAADHEAIGNPQGWEIVDVLGEMIVQLRA